MLLFIDGTAATGGDAKIDN